MPERFRRNRGLGCLLAGLLTLASAGCRTSQPLPAEVSAGWRQRLEARPNAARQRSTVRIDSEHLSGTFEAALVYRRRPSPAVRLQFFADVGGKVLDLAVNEIGVAGYFPHAGRGISHRWAEGQAPRHVLTFFAVTLLAEHARYEPSTVEESWPVEGGWRVRQSLRLSGAEVTTDLGPEGALLARELELRGARWTVRHPAPDRRQIEAPGITIDVHSQSEQPVESLPDSLFELVLPTGLRR